ncbi:SWIM zinc finger family protein [Paenibacillus aceris]|uniref:Zn finger protein n=1 Tax=Paenibacillus aceris TaxID=869555 RepID=A0ABS4I0G1_9BACL|nr:SWIM zinc finger family protein [Paenibacillus aceris]MBP1964046.1 putative Zn finger protein [Paenibacillus aceris]NHW34539.1 SWIM zinc finger family protein [Paenibacillus aceris]
MLKLQIPKNRMNYLIKQIPLHFDAAVLEQGWEYYHKGRVADIDLKGTSIQSTVAGKRLHNTTVNLEHFPDSSCSCSFDGFCQHIGATFFSLYAPYGRPELLLQQLKQQIYARKKPVRGASPAQERKEAAKANKPAEEALPADWHRFFEGRFHGFSISHQHSIETFYDSALESLPGFAADWKSSMREIYMLHIVLFMMRKIEQFYQETKSSYLSYYHENGCKIAAKNCEDKLVELAQGMDMNAIFTAEPKHMLATLKMLGEFALQGKDSPIDWLFVYRFIWWKLSGQTGAQKEEIQRLDALLAKKDLLAKKKDVLIAARAHFHIIQEDTDSAFKLLEQLAHPHAKDYFLYLNYYYNDQQWNNVLVWLRWLFKSIPQANHDDFRTFCQYWLDTTKHLDSDSEWVQVMESLLPRSYYYYTAYLLQTKRYRQWVDLQLANRISPLNLYTLELKAIEEHDAALLLPLYHQAAERAVLEKNRASYKTAVRLLKKLHAIYKQLGQNDRWEHYVYRLADKFSRLRAFQEELKKGKWIR